MLVNTALNYTGSKFKLLDQILPQLDYTKSNFIDMFCGSFVVGSNVVDKYDTIIGNDIITDLIGIHNGIINNTNIVSETISLCPGKNNPDGFSKLRMDYNENPTPSKLWALMLSSMNNMMRFNNSFKYNQTYGNRGFSESTQKKVDEYYNHIKNYVNKISLTSTHFSNLEIDSNSMVYIDPPYGYITKDGKMANTQISEAGYNAFWKKDDDIKLYDLCKDIDNKGASFMISGVLEHNDKKCWILNELISAGYECRELDFNYDKVSRKENDKKTKEVIIVNY